MTISRIYTKPDTGNLALPQGDGTVAKLTDIPPAPVIPQSIEHYRGTDHTTVVSPVAGDYTVEGSTVSRTGGVWVYSGAVWLPIQKSRVFVPFQITSSTSADHNGSYYTKASPCNGYIKTVSVNLSENFGLATTIRPQILRATFANNNWGFVVEDLTSFPNLGEQTLPNPVGGKLSSEISQNAAPLITVSPSDRLALYVSQRPTYLDVILDVVFELEAF
jgi:hypothetical protein